MSSQPPIKIKKKRGFFDMDRKEKVSFMLQILGIFGIFVAIVYVTGYVPEELKVEREVNVEKVEEIPEEVANTRYIRPDHISIDKIGVDSIIEQPDSQNVAILDESLKKGAVHYPGSGGVESGNIFLFGHSTNWKVVQNQAYKTFNDLNELENGDEIVLEADGVDYIYKVDNVKLVDESDALVDLSTTEQKLTISTCNSFGAKQERWVVEAYRVN